MRVHVLALIGLLLSGCYDFREDLFRCVRSGACEVDRDGGRDDDGGAPASHDGGTTGIRKDFCSTSGWCWQTATPKTSLEVVAVLSADDVWTMGDRGEVMHYDGARWSRVPFANTVNFRSATVTGPREFFVATTAGVQRWNGTAFSLVGSAFDADDVAVIDALDGGRDLWALETVGGRSAIFRLRDGVWASVLDSAQVLRAVAARRADDVWFVGDTVRRWDGTVFKTEPLPGATAPRLLDAWADATHVAVVGEGAFFTLGLDAGWAKITTGPEAVRAVAGVAGNDLWMLGSGGTVHHWDGAALENTGGVDGTGNGLSASDSGVWVVGTCGSISRRTATAWAPTVNNGPMATLYTVHGSAPDDIWAFGDRQVHWDGTAWSPVAASTQRIAGVFSVSPTSAFAVEADATQGILHWNGTAWSNVGLAPHRLSAVWAAPNGSAWSVGDVGTVMLTSTTEGAATSSALDSGVTVNLNAVFGSSPTDVWAVGKAGTIIHSTDGLTFARVPSPTTEELISITVDATTKQAWATSADKLTIEWNGSKWFVLDTPTNAFHRVISGTGARLVTASVFGELASGPNTGLAEEVSGTNNPLYGVWTLPAGPSIAVGACGTILAHE